MLTGNTILVKNNNILKGQTTLGKPKMAYHLLIEG